MGKFFYQGDTRAEFEDRALAHLQTVILAKLRRGESFAFSWKDDMSTGGGRTTVYLHAHSSIVFRYHGSRSPQINPHWLHALSNTANSGPGLYLVPEPAGPIIRPGDREEMTFAEVPVDSPRRACK